MKKNYSFIIPVADILRDSSRSDTIELKERFSKQLSGLEYPGIFAKINIQGMNKTSILISINEANAQFKKVCDICGKKYKEKISFKDQKTIYIFEQQSINEDYFTKIENGNNEEIIYDKCGKKYIDVENFLVQLFLVFDNVVHMCTFCKKNENKTRTDTRNKAKDIAIQGTIVRK